MRDILKNLCTRSLIKTGIDVLHGNTLVQRDIFLKCTAVNQFIQNTVVIPLQNLSL